MWTRAQLKNRGKAAFLRNYWICVVAALILTLLVGNGTSASGNSGKDSQNSTTSISEFSLLPEIPTSNGARTKIRMRINANPMTRSTIPLKTVKTNLIGPSGVSLSAKDSTLRWSEETENSDMLVVLF